MTILIAAPASGSGKTTVTLAMLAYLRKRGLRVRSFKVGPDYIDPLFHSAVTGQPCLNLDPFLTDEDYVRRSYAHYLQGQQAAIVEGVMGLFDGRAGEADFASSAHVARLLDIPVVLVIDASRVGYSLAAWLYGFTHFDPRLRIAGVILNRVGTERHARILTEAAASQNLPVLGTLPRTEAITLPDRHLGLVPVEELPEFEQIRSRLISLAETCFDWEALLPLITPPPTTASPLWAIAQGPPVRIAIARDRAFSFYYQDNLDLLAALGAELVYFSPLANEWPDCHGYVLGGGFPEVFAAQLSGCSQFWAGLRRSVEQHHPIYAECGGLMVLTRSIKTRDGQCLPMAGILEADCHMAERSVLGYRNATALKDSCALRSGEQIRGHEFHRSRLSLPVAPLLRFEEGESEGWSLKNLHASYLHLHWGAQTQIARQFVARCLAFSL